MPRFILLVLCAIGLLQCAAGQSQPPPSAAEIRAIAEQAYTFAYPLVLMEFTRRNAVAAIWRE